MVEGEVIRRLTDIVAVDVAGEAYNAIKVGLPSVLCGHPSGSRRFSGKVFQSVSFLVVLILAFDELRNRACRLSLGLPTRRADKTCKNCTIL